MRVEPHSPPFNPVMSQNPAKRLTVFFFSCGEGRILLPRRAAFSRFSVRTAGTKRLAHGLANDEAASMPRSERLAIGRSGDSPSPEFHVNVPLPNRAEPLRSRP